MNIKFGTSGWRAIISDQFTFQNVELVTQAIADFVNASKAKNKTARLIVGFDTRFLSSEFAKTAARVLSENKIRVFLTNRDTPTPVISYQIRKKKCDGAINFTASHNPPEYNGIKFSPSSGGPASPDITGDIEKRIKKLSTSPRRKKHDGSLVKVFDPAPEYTRHIKKMINFPLIRKARLRIVCDCLHGTGRDYLDKLLKEAGCLKEVLRREPDPTFGGSKPEPSEDNVEQLIKSVKANKAVLGLATDGDADRFGIIDRDGTYITPNQVICLLLYHLLKTRPRKKYVARTAATTHMVDAIAEKEGLETIETPVGFKFIGEKILGGNCLIGGEESGGLSIAGHLPEKDGILAGLLVAELVAKEKKSLRVILNELYKKYGSFYNKRIDVKLKRDLKDKLQRKLRKLKPKSIAGRKVVSIKRLDGYKFVLSDGSWVMFRFSGTEPMVRCYMESRSKKGLADLEKNARKILQADSA